MTSKNSGIGWMVPIAAACAVLIVRAQLLKVTDPHTATVAAVAGCMVLGLIGLMVWSAVRQGPGGSSGSGRRHVDRRAELLPRDRQGLRHYTSVKAGPPELRHLGLGPVVGRVVGGRHRLHLTFEDVMVAIAGARSGKTSTQVIPAVNGAPAACYTTSNKGDVYHKTRAIREQVGQVWLFDPQGLAGQGRTPTMWWNPLDLAVDIAGAEYLAGLLAAATRPADAKVDAYFDGEAESLLAQLLFAAACDGRPITQVYRWLVPPGGQLDEASAEILEQAGHPDAAAAILAVVGMPDRQRNGVMGSAKRLTSWLADPALAAWCVCPSLYWWPAPAPGPGAGAIPRFQAEQFVESTGTLYALSEKGPGSAGPLTTALTAAVLQAAEAKAAASPGGRLPVPLVCALDEAANTARVRGLDDRASHYGSKSILLMIWLQSWGQGVQAWGVEGMAKLWSSANARCYLGGATNEHGFLSGISDLLGSWQAPHSTHGPGGRSDTTRTEPIFDVATLGALPKVGRFRHGRGIVMLSGTRPVVIATSRPKGPPVRAAVDVQLLPRRRSTVAALIRRAHSS